MHEAHLYNYLWIESEDGTQFVAEAREQVDGFGVDRHQGEQVTDVSKNGGRFTVRTEDEDYQADCLVLATGTKRALPEDLGCEFDGDQVDAGIEMETSVEDAYATGAMVRDQEWQAILATGDGGPVALNVLSKETGEQFHDFDTPG
jgi:thioredoxin reductase